MTHEESIATLERFVVVLGEEIGRLNNEIDELRARLALATGRGEELASEGRPS
jgi:hypothetical protein